MHVVLEKKKVGIRNSIGQRTKWKQGVIFKKGYFILINVIWHLIDKEVKIITGAENFKKKVSDITNNSNDNHIEKRNWF